MDRIIAEVEHSEWWCAYGDDHHVIHPIPCHRVNGYRIELIESRFGSANIAEQTDSEGTFQEAMVTVRWRHGIFGLVRYRLITDVELQTIDGPNLIITGAEFNPNPIPLGSIIKCNVRIFNCGNIRIGSSADNPLGDQFILSIPLIQDLSGQRYDLSEIGLRPGLYRHEIHVNLDPGEEDTFDLVSSEPIPDNFMTRSLTGVYLTWIELQDIRINYGRDLSTLSEAIQIEFI